jgi:hypothetical protein
VSRPYDATLKHLVEAHPADCLELVGFRRPGRVDVIDADLSTVTALADKVIRVHDPSPWLAHLEFQASYDAELGSRLLLYNVLLHSRHKLPAYGVVILLRPEADGPEMTGVIRRQTPDGDPYLEFRYPVVRL